MLIGTYGGPPGKILRPLRPGETLGKPILQIADPVTAVGREWVYSAEDLPVGLDALHFGVVIQDLFAEYCSSINPDEAQTLITREVGKRMRNLTSSGVASGSLSALWTQQYGMFAKQRALLR